MWYPSVLVLVLNVAGILSAFIEASPRILPGSKTPGYVDYRGAQLWKVATKPGSKETLMRLKDNSELSIWMGNKSHVDIAVNADSIEDVSNTLKSENIDFYVSVVDLKKLIDEENPPIDEATEELQNRQGHKMTWNRYHRLNEIYGFLEYLASTYPEICTLETIGKSYQNRDLKVLKISNGNPENKAVFIDGGIHAREWISPAVVTYFINRFVENFDNESEEIRNMDWYFMPVINPDGYEFTHEVNRLWRKNLRINKSPCLGVDLNRNFGFEWGGKGTSNNPCSDSYRGPSGFSEPEPKAISEYVVNSGVDFIGYVSYHSYSQLIMYPWGYDEKFTEDKEELDQISKNMAEAINQSRGTKYKVGTPSSLLYSAAGNSMDWFREVANVKYAYTVELSDTGEYGFILPARYILPVSTESLDGLRVWAKYLYYEAKKA